MRGNSARCGRNHCYGCDSCQVDAELIRCSACDEEVERGEKMSHGLCRSCQREACEKLLRALRELTTEQIEYLDEQVEGFSLDAWMEMEEGHYAGDVTGGAA